MAQVKHLSTLGVVNWHRNSGGRMPRGPISPPQRVIPLWVHHPENARSNRMFEVRRRGLTLIAINHVKGLRT